MVDVSPELLEDIKTTRLPRLTKYFSAGICYGSIIILDDILSQIQGHGACHSWLSSGISSYSNPKAYPYLVLNCTPQKNLLCKKESLNEAILWMARESPFSEYVLNRDDTESLLSHGQIYLCDPKGEDGLTQTQILWICKVLRYAREGGQALDTWKALKDGGVDPLFAFVLSSYIASFNKTSFSYYPVTGHTNAFLQGADPEKIFKRVFVGEEVCRKSYNNTSELWGARRDFSDKVRDFCKPRKESDGWGGSVTISRANSEELIKKCLEWEEQLRTEYKIPKITEVLPTQDTVYLDVDM